MTEDRTTAKASCAVLILLVTFPITSCDIYDLFNPDIFNAPEIVEIDGCLYSLSTELSRNNMPGTSEASGNRFSGIVTHTAKCPSQPEGPSPEHVMVPENIDMTRLWIINREERWHTRKLEDYGLTTDPPNIMCKSVRGDLMWVDIYVDVVMEIVNRSTGRRCLLKTSDQYNQEVV